MQDVEEVLTRGVADILPNKNSLKKLMGNRKVTLYQGYDPSSPYLHIGNLVGIRKLAQFQRLGHQIVFLIGDFTGMIGDPTDKAAARKKLTHKQVLANAKDYQRQIQRVLDFKGKNKAKILYNSEWLSRLKFEEIVELSSNFTVQQLIERDFFQERIKNQKPIYLHEFLYPLMQAYDCVFMNIDLEIGGSDQLFNMMAGRTLMKNLKNKEKYVLTLKLLEDPTGKKMGKSEGNTINLTDQPADIFGKIMALPDGFIELGIELLTGLPLDFAKGKNPADVKKAIAYEVICQIKGEEEAERAQSDFEKKFQKREPEYKKEIAYKSTLLEVVSQVMGSVSQAKRLIKQGAVDVDGKVVEETKFEIKGGEEIKIGKKTFVKVRSR